MESFLLVSTPRYDPGLAQVNEHVTGWLHDKTSPFFLLDYHLKRLLKGARYFKWEAAIAKLEKPSAVDDLIIQLQNLVGTSQDTGSPLKLRILVNSNGQITCEKYDAPPMAMQNLVPSYLPPPGTAETGHKGPSHSPEYVVVLDTVGTAASEHTYFKTTYRPMYDAARKRAGLALGDLKEVLLVNESRSEVREGSTTTPYFWRGGRWVTPPISREYIRQDTGAGQDGTSRRWALDRGLAQEEVVAISSLIEGEQCWLSNGARGFLYGRIHLS